MSDEFIGLNPPAQVYGIKNLLYCEMELLSILKRYRSYKQLRKQELAIKVLLRKKIRELKAELKTFNELLPKVDEEEIHAKAIGEPKRRFELEMEIDEIKRKLTELQ
jgi:hypothetical protein